MSTTPVTPTGAGSPAEPELAAEPEQHAGPVRTMRPSARSLTVIVVVLALGSLIAWAGSSDGPRVEGVPVFAGAVGVVLLIQWIAFAISYLAQTERYFDLMGSFTYVVITIGLLALSAQPGPRAVLLSTCVILWALRLGLFLYARIRRFGGDDRFDEITPDLWRFASVWTVQALWVSATAMAAWVVISAGGGALEWTGWFGYGLWVLGLGIEIRADIAKWKFKADPANAGRFIRDGLWSISRHPNYLGEILLWIGVFIIAAPALRGAQWVAVLSPVFVIILLTRVSGIPLLERKADARWGGDTDYERYKARTPVLVPLIGRRG